MGPTIVEFADPVKLFTDDKVVRQLLDDLNKAGVFSADTPRRLRSAAAARNEVRRKMLGIRRYLDVKIPLRNGSLLYADVFRPDKPGKFPVIMNFGVYGRAFVHHSIGDELATPSTPDPVARATSSCRSFRPSEGREAGEAWSVIRTSPHSPGCIHKTASRLCHIGRGRACPSQLC